MRWLYVAGLMALTCIAARADKLVVVAGGGVGGDGARALDFRFVEPFGIDFDRAGNAYVVELSGGRVLKIDQQGVVTTIAGGLKQKGDAGDGGPAAKATFNGLHNLAVHPSGDIYLADTWNHKVRKIDSKTGTISTLAGVGQKGYAGDGGPAARALFGGIYCVSLDPRGEKLYLADLDNRRVRVIDLATGVVNLVAGNGQRGVPQDGADAQTQPLVDPRAVAADAKGNVYILERGGHALRVVDPAGKIRTVAGTGKQGGTGDGGDALQATMSGPKHLCVDKDGSVIIADAENNLVRRYLPAEGKIVRIAGTGKKGNAGAGGPPQLAEVARPHGVTIHPLTGLLYIVDSYNDRIVRIEN